MIQIRCFAPKAGQENRNLTARSIHMHILRKGHSQASFSWNLELQIMQEDSRWRSIRFVVRTCRRRSDGEALLISMTVHLLPQPQDRQFDVSVRSLRDKRTASASDLINMQVIQEFIRNMI